MKNFVLQCILCLSSCLAYAGSGVYPEFYNDTKEAIVITGVGTNCWYTNDLPSKGEQITIPPGVTRKLYTETDNSIFHGCNNQLGGVVSDYLFVELRKTKYYKFSVARLGEKAKCAGVITQQQITPGADLDSREAWPFSMLYGGVLAVFYPKGDQVWYRTRRFEPKVMRAATPISAMLVLQDKGQCLTFAE